MYSNGSISFLVLLVSGDPFFVEALCMEVPPYKMLNSMILYGALNSDIICFTGTGSEI